MKNVIDKLLVVPMSWLLAVPIVLLDRLISQIPPNLRTETNPALQEHY
jgi:hypothetical protein